MNQEYFGVIMNQEYFGVIMKKDFHSFCNVVI